MSQPTEEMKDEMPDVTGIDSDFDFVTTEKGLYDENQSGGRRMSETLMDMASDFADKFGEGARRLSEHQVQGWEDEN